MTTWLLPATTAAFWAGLLASERARVLAPPWAWFVPGIAALIGALAAAPSIVSAGSGSLEAAGLVHHVRPPATTAVAPTEAGLGRGPPIVRNALVAVGVLLVGTGWGGLQAARVDTTLLGRLAPERVDITGTLRTDPATGRFGWWAILDATSARTTSGEAWSIHEPVWLEGDGSPPASVRGDRIASNGVVTRPDPGPFAESLVRRGIGVEMRADSLEPLGSSASPLVRSAQAFRAFVGRSIGRLFPAREAGLLMGLSLGDDSRLDPSVARDFQATGLGHLLVVSGENVAMVLAPMLALGVLLRLRRTGRLVLGLGTTVFFVVLTGAEPSVMRAGVMASLTLVGVFLGRPRSTASILAAAVLLLLIIDPTLVWSIGFQLSVAATAGMVALASPLSERLRFLPKPVALAAGTTMAAQCGVSPLLLFHFHEVPGITLLANLLAFPAVSPALILGLVAAGAGLVVEPVGRAVAALALVPMRYLELVADRLARAPIPWVTSGGGALPLVAGLVAVGGLAWWLRSGRRLPRGAVVAIVALVPLFVWSTALSAGPPGGLVLRFFDVGQGDAALVTSPGGAAILFDGGPDPEQVASKLSALGIHRLDAVVATHPHADHIVGLPAVLSRFPVGEVLDPGCPDDSPFSAELEDAIRAEAVPELHPHAGETLRVGDLQLDVLSPEECWSGTNSDANNDSLVIMVRYRGDSALFAAEPEEPAQQVMLDDDEPLHAQVLKVPHHGAATSLAEFFQAVAPTVAIVSVGPNDYGHPVPETLQEIRATGAEVLRTDRSGDITVTFSSGGLEVASSGP